MHNSLFNSVVSTLAICALASACTVQGEAPPVLDHRDVHLTLLHTADWHSRLFPYNMTVSATDASLGLSQGKAPFGGAARMNWLIQRERSRSDRVLHLDSGDCFQGAPIFNFFGGEAEVRALNATGVDGVVVGNHEFDRGAQNFAYQYRTWATFPVLAANYLTDDPTTPGSPGLSGLLRPYHIYNLNGLKVAVIGFGNLSTITSLFDQPNRLGLTALNTHQIAQFYIDMVQDQGADVVIGLSHLGLTEDQNMIANTTGLDAVLGGHLHIVLNPSQEVLDCEPVDANGQHFIAELDVNADASTLPNGSCDAAVQCCSPNGVCPPAFVHGQATGGWRLAPGFHARNCPGRRSVILQHSGAFMKYLGRLDFVLSNDPSHIAQRVAGDAGVTGSYDPRNRFEIVGHRFQLFPVDNSVPEDPVMARLLEPYHLALDRLANLDSLVGYAPSEVSRTNVGGGDSPIGNTVTTSMWRRLGIQTDFALTNTLGIRDNFPQGPVAIDQIFNVFPFDNSITTLQLSGREVLEMFDFIARRSSDRGCNSQAQIAGARVVLSCGGCDRDGIAGLDTDTAGLPLAACAQTVNIGLERVVTGVPTSCNTDSDCNCPPDQRACGTTCVALASDANNCGSCGHACSGGMVCSAGVCQPSCGAGLTPCGAACVPLQTDRNNCGACGMVCGAGLGCANGACAEQCAAGLTNCLGYCIQLTPEHPMCPNAPQLRSLCETNAHRCMLPLSLNASYALAANDYIAGGGSGFFVLQRNTTQVNTYVQLRDALVDYIQQGNPCGYDPTVAMQYRSAHPDQRQQPDDGLRQCMTDGDCGDGSICSCGDVFHWNGTSSSMLSNTCSHATCGVADPSTGVMRPEGRCVLQNCFMDVGARVEGQCPNPSPASDPHARERCLCNAQSQAAETCRLLACFDRSEGAVADGRIQMVTTR